MKRINEKKYCGRVREVVAGTIVLNIWDRGETNPEKYWFSNVTRCPGVRIKGEVVSGDLVRLTTWQTEKGKERLLLEKI